MNPANPITDEVTGQMTDRVSEQMTDVPCLANLANLANIASEPTELQKTFVNYLLRVRAMRQSMRDVGYHYFGIEDFLLQHGQWYTAEPWVGRFKEGRPKACFTNALVTAEMEGLRYVEGLATTVDLSGLPFQHAWNLTEDGRMVDTTWRERGELYLGVEFALGRVWEVAARETCVLDDYGHGHPLFRSPWKGEDFSAKWELDKRTERIRKITRGGLGW